MERTIQAPTTIEDGLHKGVITKVEERLAKEKYHYIDVFIEFEDGKNIKQSFSDYLSSESKLGKLVGRFGCDINKVGQVIKLNEILIGRTCQFMSLKEGKYSNVVEDSLKPVEHEKPKVDESEPTKEELVTMNGE